MSPKAARSARRSKAPLKKAPPKKTSAKQASSARVVTPLHRDAKAARAILKARKPLPPPPHDDLARRAFTLCTLNCNGLRSAQRRGFSAWLARNRPDVLCLQEVRAWPEQLPPELRSPPGYNTRFLNAGKKGYSGVATFSRPAGDRHSEGSGLSWGDEEGRVLRSEFGGLVVINLYAPSGSSSADRQLLKYEYLAHLEEVMDGLLQEGRPVLLCGDLNVAPGELDIHDPKSNARNSGFLPDERAWFGRLLERGWVDVLRHLHPDEPGLYSWWSNRGAAREKDLGWRIDHVLVDASMAARAEEVRIDKRAGLSDHAPVTVRFGPA